MHRSYQKRRVNRRNQLLFFIVAIIMIGITWWWPFGSLVEEPTLLQIQLAMIGRALFALIWAVISLVNGWPLLRYVVKFGIRRF